MTAQDSPLPTQRAQSPHGNLPRFEIVFLDMDGVLSDFQGAACKIHDRMPPRELAMLGIWKPQEWLMWDVFKIPVEKFWQVIDESPNFWHDMPKTPYCYDVIGIAKALAPSVRVLSTAWNHGNSYSGKWHWCRQYLPGIPITLNEDTPGERSKALLARPGRLLIDDSDENCEAFRAAGGSAILFPQHWNSAHDKAPFGPMFYLAQELEKLKRDQDMPWAARQPAAWNPPPLSSMGVQVLDGCGCSVTVLPAVCSDPNG